MTKETNILDLPMQDNDANAKTIRDYMKALLTALWTEGECFSGKRPLGNSDWEHDVYTALVRGGVVDGTLDEWGCVDDAQEAQALKFILTAIKEL